jgi:microsomal dipeptidase-like Zn-dependent dipeptidase
MVMLAVSNETLCRFLGNERACDDMSNVDRQLKAARDLERYIDEQNNCHLDGDGWYRIATSPAEARQIIASGGMAVVLGAEVDTLFGCRPMGGCDADSVVAAIERYRALGVRHVFPVHVLDNGFGGAAAYADFFNFGNLAANGDLLHVRDCAPDYSFRFGEVSSDINALVGNIASKLGITYKKYPSMGAHCNWRGLTALGGMAIRALMKAKMIIDVDHMSATMRNEVFDLAEKQKYAGLVSSHTGYTELYRGNKKSEGQLTSREVERLVALGGRMAPILHQGARGDMHEFKDKKGNVRVIHDCGNSAKSFAQAFLYAAKAARGGGVGFGSDLNGLAGLPTPRFGPYACGGDISAEQQRKVIYPVATYPGMGPALPRSQAGNRVFDINVDGYAHAGMFPDFVAELRAVGLTDHDLMPLFSSAEAYISMWECAEDPNGEACARSR